MKYSPLICLAIMICFFSSVSSCGNQEPTMSPDTNTLPSNNDPQTIGKVKMKIGSKVFTATLADNHSAKAFVKTLPLTLDMMELNHNEKYSYLPNSLPTNPSRPKTIKRGDLMLYGSKTLVLFYNSFSSSYSYTRLGAIDDITGLEEALGEENVIVRFESE